MTFDPHRPVAFEWVSGEARETSLDEVHAALERMWERTRPPADDVFRMLFDTAVAEVAANILEHARPDRGTMRVDLELSVWPDRVEARFSDDGRPMAQRIVARGLGASDLPPERGRGLHMALVALDELGYESVEGRNEWRLVKRRPAMAPSGSAEAAGHNA